MTGESRGSVQGGDSPDVFAMPALVTAAHELKSPLALIRQYALILEDTEVDPAMLARTAERLELTSERALRLVEDLTRTQRLDDALFELEPINPLALCDEVVSELKPLYAAHDRTLQTIRRRQTPLVVGNRTLLRSVLTNFADNALKYTVDASAVQLDTRVHGGKVRISVRDYGPGLASDASQTLSMKRPARRPASSGLGLYIARQFAQAMSGRVGVVRHRDGASYYIELSGSTQMSLL